MSPVALLSFMWILVKEIKESLISLLLYFLFLWCTRLILDNVTHTERLNGR